MAVHTTTSRWSELWQFTSGWTHKSTLLPYLSAIKLSYLLSAVVPRYLCRNGFEPAKKLHSTSYLDGLRGIAAVVVMNHHHLPFRWTWLLEQPFFNVIYAGRAMVDVFFVISGYVLSYRMLKLMRNKEYTLLFDALVSATFRRYLRLYGSAFVASFIGLICLRLGWDFPLKVGLSSPTFFGEVYRWIIDFTHFANPFADMQGFWGPGTLGSDYGMTLWTLPIEFRGSLVLYFFCLASCKLSTRNRMVLCWIIIISCYLWAVVYPALFLGGLFLADLSISRNSKRLSYTSIAQTADTEHDLSLTDLPFTQDSERLLSAVAGSPAETASNPPKQSLSERILFVGVLVVAIFLLSQPDLVMEMGDMQKASWPWPQLDRLIPPQFRGSGIWEHFYLSIGSILLVWALDSYPVLQTPLRWNFCQYLGNVSFGIYITHTLVMASFWMLFLDPIRKSLLGEAMWTMVPFMVLYWAMVLWVAELFTKIDNKLVAAGKELQNMLFVE